MKPIIKTVLICAVILAIGVAGFVGLKATRPTPPKKVIKSEGPLLKAQTAKKEDIKVWVKENGTVTPKTTMDVIVEAPGIIVEVSPNLMPGYFVNKGEKLIQIDPREFKLSVQSNKAQIAQLEAEKARILQERENIRLNLELEQEKLKLAEAELERKRSLLDTASVSQSEVDRQAIEAKTRETALLAQKNALALMKSQVDVIDAKIEATKAQLEMSKLKLEKTTISAPFDGRVTSESAEEGEYAPVGQKLASIFDISAMEIIVNLSSFKMIHLEVMKKFKSNSETWKDVNAINRLIRKYGPNAEVTFKWSDNIRVWRGKVTRMTGQLDVATRTVPLVVEVKDPYKNVVPGESPPLVPGMFVDVALEGRTYKDVVRAPRAALHRDKVYLAKDGKLEIREVKTVMRDRDHVLVSEGISDGDKIIVSPISTPIPGMAVRVVEDSQE